MVVVSGVVIDRRSGPTEEMWTSGRCKKEEGTPVRFYMCGFYVCVVWLDLVQNGMGIIFFLNGYKKKITLKLDKEKLQWKFLVQNKIS